MGRMSAIKAPTAWGSPVMARAPSSSGPSVCSLIADRGTRVTGHVRHHPFVRLTTESVQPCLITDHRSEAVRQTWMGYFVCRSRRAEHALGCRIRTMSTRSGAQVTAGGLHRGRAASPRTAERPAGTARWFRGLAGASEDAHVQSASGGGTGSRPPRSSALLYLCQETRPRRKPWATAWARSRTPSLRNSRRAWVLTVSSDR